MFCKVYKYGEVYRVVGFLNGDREDPDPGRPKPKENNAPREPPTERLPEHVARARSRIRELALCNPWDYFVTLTLGQTQDRSDLARFKTRLGQCLDDYARKYGCARPKYLLIPEQHKDGESWHMHGLFRGLDPRSIQTNEHGYPDVPYFRRRLGFLSFSPVRDGIRIASYITKYISKSISATPFKAGEHMYLASNGLQGKELYFCGALIAPDWDWVNDWVAVKELSADTIGEWLKAGEEYLKFYEERQRDISDWEWGDILGRLSATSL